jgi:hypothetical protein
MVALCKSWRLDMTGEYCTQVVYYMHAQWFQSSFRMTPSLPVCRRLRVS